MSAAISRTMVGSATFLFHIHCHFCTTCTGVEQVQQSRNTYWTRDVVHFAHIWSSVLDNPQRTSGRHCHPASHRRSFHHPRVAHLRAAHQRLPPVPDPPAMDFPLLPHIHRGTHPVASAACFRLCHGRVHARFLYMVTAMRVSFM